MKLNMKLCQKLEFWILAVPALMVSLGAIAHYGVWRMLWVFPVGYVLATVTQFCRNMVYEVVDTPRTNACRAGKWPREFGLVMLMPLYNWFVAAMFVDCVNLLIVWRYHGSMPLPFVYCIVFAVGFAVPTVVRELRGGVDGGYGEVIVEAERWMLLAMIPMSAFVNITPGLFALAMAVVGILAVGTQGALWYKNEHKQFFEYLEAEKRGSKFVSRRAKRWFPRPGVIYEPGKQLTGILVGKVSLSDWEKGRRAFTILSVSPVAFLSFAILVGGAAVLVDRGRGLVLLSSIAAFVLWSIHSGSVAKEKWDTWENSYSSALPNAFFYWALGSMVVLLGTDDLMLRIATGAFLVGCFEFPTRFIVRASSERNPDGLRFFATVGAVALAILVSEVVVPDWYICGLCAMIAAFPFMALRHFWPPKTLVQPGGTHTGQPDAVSDDPAAKERRDRKRQRQMDAFRRSQRG